MKKNIVVLSFVLGMQAVLAQSDDVGLREEIKSHYLWEAVAYRAVERLEELEKRGVEVQAEEFGSYAIGGRKTYRTRANDLKDHIEAANGKLEEMLLDEAVSRMNEKEGGKKHVSEGYHRQNLESVIEGVLYMPFQSLHIGETMNTWVAKKERLWNAIQVEEKCHREESYEASRKQVLEKARQRAERQEKERVVRKENRKKLNHIE